VRIRLDATPHSVVALCPCGWRSGVEATRTAAYSAALSHCRNAGHPTEQAAAAVRSRRMRENAA
jgi:hypothetical protein